MRLFLPAAAVAALLSTAACNSGPSAPVDSQAYVKQITEARAVKDKTFKEEPEPIPVHLVQLAGVQARSASTFTEYAASRL